MLCEVVDVKVLLDEQKWVGRALLLIFSPRRQVFVRGKCGERDWLLQGSFQVVSCNLKDREVVVRS